MFYRVDYMLAVQLAGLLIGIVFSRRTASISADRLARSYYATITVVLVFRTCAVLAGMFLGGSLAKIIAALMGDSVGFLFGALFGLALHRRNSREFLVHPSILSALCMTLAFTFALAAVGKTFTFQPITEFFIQSGYSIAFLKFIISVETLGAIGLLLPWAVWPALLGLSIDMFGAVATHIHNGDPLNDSTGAIALLIRMGALGILLGLRPRATRPIRSLRTSVAVTSGAMIACLLLSVAGSVAMRNQAKPAAASASPPSR